MPKYDEFCIIVPTRNAPDKCVDIAKKLTHAAQASSFDYTLKIVFLVNDSDPLISADLEKLLAAENYPTGTVDIIRSDKDYLTAEENIKNNLSRNLDKISDRFVVIGNSDTVNFDALSQALDFMKAHRIDLLLVGLNNYETWQNEIVRHMYSTPTLFYRKNFLSRDNCFGPDVYGHTMLDYGPVDFLAYIGCQIYTKPVFRDLCAVKLREPLYSLPMGTLEVTERGIYNIGFYHPATINRIDALYAGPDKPDYPPGWWVWQSRTQRGLSQHIALSVISSSLDLCDSAFAKYAASSVVSVQRAQPLYIFWNYLSAIVRELFTTFLSSQQNPGLRYTPPEIADIHGFGKRLEAVDLSMTPADQARLCAWLQHFPYANNFTDIAPLQEWASQAEAVFKGMDARPDLGQWLVKKVA